MIRSLTIFSHNVAQGEPFGAIAANLAQGFVDRGVDVNVLYLKQSLGRDVEFPQSTRITRLAAPRSLLSVGPLARYLRTARPDVLISLGTMQNAPSVLARMASRFQGALLLSEHHDLSYKALVEHRRDLRFRTMPAFARRFYPKGDGLAAVSEDVLRDLVEQVGISPGRLPMRVIHNPIDVVSIRQAAREPIAHPWFRQNKDPVILNVARLARQKNQRLLLEAVARIRSQRRVRLIILGEGPMRANLQHAVRQLGLDGCVYMPGHVENPFPYFARADAFVLSSEEEGFGLVLLEAMACGCPVIATACPGGPREILQDGRNGALTPAGDAEALASVLTRVLDDVDYRTALIESGSRRVQEFAPAKIAGEWLAFAAELRDARATDSGTERASPKGAF